MRRIAAAAALSTLTVLILTGCFSGTTVTAMRPANHAKSPTFDSKETLWTAVLHVKLISAATAEVLHTARDAGSDFSGATGALEMAIETALAPIRARQPERRSM